jgi:formamidopyrimidine-DNA glycosylase
MPEFAEVNLQVRYLRERCTGWPIASYGVEGWSHFQNLPEDQRTAMADAFFKDNVLQAITQKGKQVVFQTKKGTMLSHLMFKGRWSVAGDDFLSNYKQHKKPPTAKSNNFWLLHPNGARLNFHEPEYKGKITIYPDKLPHEVESLQQLGPDVLLTPETDPHLAQAWEIDTFTKLLARSGQAIKVFLLDQKRQAGIGNMYACESLYLAGIAPARPAKSLSTQEIKRLHSAVQSILQEAIDSELDYDRLLKIYRKEQDPDGLPVEEADIGGRDTFWVPAKQA